MLDFNYVLLDLNSILVVNTYSSFRSLATIKSLNDELNSCRSVSDWPRAVSTKKATHTITNANKVLIILQMTKKFPEYFLSTAIYKFA